MREPFGGRLRARLYTDPARGFSTVNRKPAGVSGQDFRFDIECEPGNHDLCI